MQYIGAQQGEECDGSRSSPWLGEVKFGPDTRVFLYYSGWEYGCGGSGAGYARTFPLLGEVKFGPGTRVLPHVKTKVRASSRVAIHNAPGKP